MQLEWVNHASFIFRYEQIRLITDPWIEGSIFNDGWKLLSETKLSYENFKDISHIWFSHEHPDHFFPPNLKKIPIEIRKNIVVLFQETSDKKVVNYCKSLQFKEVIELEKDKWYPLSPSLKILCEPFEDDSWLCIKGNGISLLNLNDCVLNVERDIQSIKNKVGEVDILLTQFSYANWVGNIEEEAKRINSANEKLARIELQAKIIDPKYIIPFASFVWFSHEENYYLNKNINTISKAYKFIKNNTQAEPIVLYPGNVWNLFDRHNSAPAIESYNRDYQSINVNPLLTKSKVIELNELKNTANQFLQKIVEHNDSSIKYYLKPVKIFLTDLNKSYQLSFNGGLEEVDHPYENCDVALSSDSLYYCFKFSWGFNTLSVNGRYQIPSHGNYKRFRRFIVLTTLNNAGKKFNFFDYVKDKVLAKLSIV